MERTESEAITMTEELLSAWRRAEAQTRDETLTTDERDAAQSAAHDAHDRYRDRIESLDGAARDLGSLRPDPAA
jgi:hypothetical protein